MSFSAALWQTKNQGPSSIIIGRGKCLLLDLPISRNPVFLRVLRSWPPLVGGIPPRHARRSHSSPNDLFARRSIFKKVFCLLWNPLVSIFGQNQTNVSVSSGAGGGGQCNHHRRGRMRRRNADQYNRHVNLKAPLPSGGQKMRSSPLPPCCSCCVRCALFRLGSHQK